MDQLCILQLVGGVPGSRVVCAVLVNPRPQVCCQEQTHLILRRNLGPCDVCKTCIIPGEHNTIAINLISCKILHFYQSPEWIKISITKLYLPRFNNRSC